MHKSIAHWVLTAVLVLAASVASCKKAASPTPDAGGARDGQSDSSCTNDNGMRNRSKGQECTCGLQCASGFCADGFCCDKACDGTCMSCGLPLSLGSCTPVPNGVEPPVKSQCQAQDPSSCQLDGTCDGRGKCRNYESGTVCMPGACNSDAITGTFVCDGARNCLKGPSTTCAPFSCAAGSGQCYSTCNTDADCVSGRRCTNGSCGPKANGALCPMGNAECASGFCADGVCCNTACTGPCLSCNLVGKQGSCTPISAGKGHPLCALQSPSTCGTTGVCDGFGICAPYPATTPCTESTCIGTTAMNTASTCDGLGTCGGSEVQSCGKYRCANGSCNSKCTTSADCADGIACVTATGSCGPKLDGQQCAADADCFNAHCVDSVCCNTACSGACRSCALTGSVGKCTLAANGASDPRNTCTDMTATTCGTDGKCDGTGGCRKYPAGTTVCAPETCNADVYAGPSTCNASGQCIKPNAVACYPYHCNVSKCFTACTTTNANTECIPPNICGMNNNISSCGLKPIPSPCSGNSECASGFCSQGVCCNSACNTACQACNLPGTVGRCTAVAGGVDPQRLCAIQAQASCGTTGQCVAGQCARWASGSQCLAASCPTASTRAPPSTCNGSGTCVAAATMSCAPGRCAAATCTNMCTTNLDCTAPATCVGNSCGLQPKGGACTATSMCAAGLTCYLSEGSTGVCCDTACNGTCESCKLPGLVGTCSPVAAGAVDPDPASACVAATDPTTCGLNGRCAGNNTATNATGAARCQNYGSTQGCRSRSCVAGTATTPATETAAASCTGAGACGAVATNSCSPYNKCTGPNIQCATSCTTNADCVGVSCNTQTGKCGDKLGAGAVCGVATDCTSGFCVDGFCCNTVCGGACQSCAENGNVGTCTNVQAMCNDSNVCNGLETCSTAGACVAGTAPALDDGNPCTVDACTMKDGITHLPGNMGAVCRPSAGACDVAEVCNGTTATCPPDTFALAITQCRAAATGGCDVAESCTGISAACPADAFALAITVCRAAVTGGCDVAETCTGTSASCPADSVVSANTVCRPAVAGGCDVREVCNGTSPSCPTDVFAPATTECRPVAGACDVAESCTGTSATCPADAMAPASTQCRMATGLCDLAAMCNGTSVTCPANGIAPSTIICRPAAGGCDIADHCSGSSAGCPADAVQPNGTECRPAAGACDVPEVCNGTSSTCPTNGFAPSTTVCRPSIGVCDVAENCSGTSATCPVDGAGGSGMVCRPATGECDVEEKCDGTSTSCPTDQNAMDGTACTLPDAGVCNGGVCI